MQRATFTTPDNAVTSAGSDFVFDPKAPVVYGSEEWKKQCEREVALRPQVLPMDKRHVWTPAELEALRQNVASGMKREDAVRLALGTK